MRFGAHEIGVVAALAIALGGCANVDENKDAWFSKPFQFVSRNGGYTFSELQESKNRARPITANDLVAANGSCPAPQVQQSAPQQPTAQQPAPQQAAVAPPAAPASIAAAPAAAAPAADQPGSASAASGADPLLGGGIALGMTECDVVFRAGAPNAVQIGKNPNGDRTAVLTFSGGPRPGIYHFEAGSLMEVERGATPPAATQTAKKKPVPKPGSKQASAKQAAKE